MPRVIAETKEYVRPMPVAWWLMRRTYTLFMIRELTSVAVGAYTLFLLVLVARARDAAVFEEFCEGLKSPVSVVLHLVALALVMFHVATWFNVMPQAIVLWRGEDRVPPRAIVAGAWVAWVVVSAAIAWLALG